MKTQDLINDWIEASNTFDTKKYLSFYLSDAILDDPSVGKKFSGHAAIKEYFNSYFIGYNTHTEIVNIDISGEHQVHLEVKFTGDFPEGNTRGTFDFTFKNGKISYLKADLLH
tara:strand:- start:17 stop:355 length:339 start_codon:yes stop_codon:yes gene_type:complete